MERKNNQITTKDYFLIIFSAILLNFGITFPIGLAILAWIIIQKLKILYYKKDNIFLNHFYN